MGVFDIWRPNPEKEKPKESPLALPHKEGPKHFLPGPTAPEKPKTIKEIFSIFSPKESKEPKKPEAKQSFFDALIPESERGGIYEGSPEPFDQERPSPTFRPSYSQEPRFRGRQQTWRLPNPEELSGRLTEIFNLDEIFGRVLAVGKDWFPGIENISYDSAQRSISLVQVAPVDDYDVLGSVFGIPRSVIDSYVEVPPEQAVAAADDLWNDILWPLLDMTTASFELLKPQDIRGWFQLGPGRKDPGILELQYSEAI